jgi:uncharacterized protein
MSPTLPNSSNAADGALIGDGMQFARDRRSISGSVDIDRLPRIAAAGASSVRLAYSIGGFVNALGFPSFHVRVDGNIALTCQRCLEPVAVDVAINRDLELRETLEEVEGADDEVDRLLAVKAMDAAVVVEDEVLLDMPMVARHEACEPAADEALAVRRASPFAALAKRR